MRKTKTITIEADGRDKGKAFVITEMPAAQAEKWAARALLAISRSGLDVPSDVTQLGMAGVVAMGVQALTSIPFAEAEPLMDEMMACAQIKPGESVVRALNETSNPATVNPDIEEVKTRLLLRAEVAELHTGFSVTAALSRLGEAAKAMANTPSPSTSRRRSPPSSPRGARASKTSKPTTA